jgi:hypothetical protein
MKVKIDTTNSYPQPSRIGQGSSGKPRSHKKLQAPTIAPVSAAKPKSKNTPYIRETEEEYDSLWAAESPPKVEVDDEIVMSQTIPKLQPSSKKAKPKSNPEIVSDHVSPEEDSIAACLKDLKEDRSEVRYSYSRIPQSLTLNKHPCR